MRGRARAAGGRKRGLWSLISRLFGAPKGRHVMGAPPPLVTEPPTEPAPTQTVPAPTEPPTEPASALPVPLVQAAVPAAATPSRLASVRLIFMDGSVVALPEGSLEERQAQYLASRVLEAGGRS